jgi:hypothetical protein
VVPHALENGEKDLGLLGVWRGVKGVIIGWLLHPLTFSFEKGISSDVPVVHASILEFP